jgi:hypothetical protein
MPMSFPVFPTVYLPPVEYFACLVGKDEICLETHEHYQRQSYRNRCCVYGPNGLQKLVVPVVHPAKEQKNIRDVRIDNSARWQQIHWRSLTSAYNKSPFFEYYASEFEPFFQHPQQWLLETNTELLKVCLKLLRLQVNIDYTDTFRKDISLELDYRSRLLEKRTLQPHRFPRYSQVFEPTHGFMPNLSILDLLFNRGNDALSYLKTIKDL